MGWNAKKTGFKRGPEKKMKENGVGWLLNKNTFTYEIDLKFFLRCVQICNKTLFFYWKIFRSLQAPVENCDLVR